ncbi:hypothetical protein IGI04_019358, partial [Brassica rapa subsp. trilocularis]
VSRFDIGRYELVRIDRCSLVRLFRHENIDRCSMSSSETNARNRELRSKRRFDETSSSTNPQPLMHARRGISPQPAEHVPELRTHRHRLSPTSRTYQTSLCTTRETFRGSWWTLFRPSGLECLVGAGEPHERRHQHQQQHAGTLLQRTMRRLMRTPTSPHISISSPPIMNLANIRQGTSSLTPSTCKNFCASPSIDMERIISIDSRRVTSIDMEYIDRCVVRIDNTIDAEVDQPNYKAIDAKVKGIIKLTFNTNLTSLLVLGLGIHGIGFFRQVWKTPTKEFKTGLGGDNLQGSLLQRTLGYRSKRSEQSLVATTIKF